MGAFPDIATLEAALDTAAQAPSVDNAQPWRWRVGRSGIDLYADWSRRLGDAESDRRDVLLSCGAVLDHCVLALTAAGWYPRVHRFPDRDDAAHLAMIELIEAPPSPSGIELVSAIPRRRADRRRFDARPIPAGTLEFFYIRAARSAVRMGVVPHIRWSRGDQGDVALDFGGGNGGPTTDDATLMVLGTDTDDNLMRLQAGETLSRLVLSAAAMGLATCPLTQPLHNARDRLALACEVFDGEAYPQALIRLGWAPTDADPLEPVPRRPIRETTVWDGSDRRR